MQLTSDHSRNEGNGLIANIASRRCRPLFPSFSSKSAGVSGCVKNFTESKRPTDEAPRKCYRHLVIASALKLKRRQYPGLHIRSNNTGTRVRNTWNKAEGS